MKSYENKEISIEGIITRVKDGLVSMDLKGRLGDLTVPKRMIISDDEIKVGMEVKFKMTFPVVKKEKSDKKNDYKNYKL